MIWDLPFHTDFLRSRKWSQCVPTEGKGKITKSSKQMLTTFTSSFHWRRGSVVKGGDTLSQRPQLRSKHLR